MKSHKYSESIFCTQCRGRVRMLDCRMLDHKAKGRVQIEFDTVCVHCGARASAVLDKDFLHFSEREFCQEKELPCFHVKRKGVVVYRKVKR